MWLKEEVFEHHVPGWTSGGKRHGTGRRGRREGEDEAREIVTFARALERERCTVECFINRAQRELACSEEDAKLIVDFFKIFRDDEDDVDDVVDAAQASLYVLSQTYKRPSPSLSADFINEPFPSPRREGDAKRSKKTKRSPTASDPKTPRKRRSPVRSSPSPPSPRCSALKLRTSDASSRLFFLKSHLNDVLRIVVPERYEANVQRRHVDALSILFDAGFDLDRRLPRLSDACPSNWWISVFEDDSKLGSDADDETDVETDVTIEMVSSWMSESLTINEVAYPSLEAPSTTSPLSRSTARITPRTDDGKNELDVFPPVCVSDLSGKTMFVSSHEARGRTVYIHHCTDSRIHVPTHVRFVSVVGCNRCTVFVGAATGICSVEYCDQVDVTVATRQLRVNNSLDCVIYTYTPQRPILYGDCRSIRFAPHNVFSSTRLKEIVATLGKKSAKNQWNNPMDFTSARKSQKKRVASTTLSPDEFVPFTSEVLCDETTVSTTMLYELPDEYTAALRQRDRDVALMREKIAAMNLTSEQTKALHSSLAERFHTWVSKSSKYRSLLDLPKRPPSSSGIPRSPRF